MKRWADNVTAILPERLLHAYVDVLLPPAKRRAVQSALIHQPELREAVEVWRQQNADIRKLALLQTPGPMPAAMAGVTHQLETRLSRFAPLECLRRVAVFALLLAGIAGTMLMTQTQLDRSNRLVGPGSIANAAGQTYSKPVPLDPNSADAERPEQKIDTVVVTADAPLETPEPVVGNAVKDGIDMDNPPATPDIPVDRANKKLRPDTDAPDPDAEVAETSKPVGPPRDI